MRNCIIADLPQGDFRPVIYPHVLLFAYYTLAYQFSLEPNASDLGLNADSEPESRRSAAPMRVLNAQN